ncbi:MAG: hypothetical protein RI967_601 [Planctomycetota bacterium]
MHRSTLRPSRFRLHSALLTAALAVGGALTVAPVAEAQFGGRSGMATMFIPDFYPRDLPVFVDALQLEEWQRPIMEALLEDYVTEFNTAADGVRLNMGNLKDVAPGTSGDAVVEMITKPLVAWTAEKRKLHDDFLTGVRSQLSELQLELWPRLERSLRREKSLPNGELSGESINLLLVCREADVSPVEMDAIRPILDEYEVKLDEALAARDGELESAIQPLFAAMSSGDSNAGLALQDRIMTKRIAIRSVQEAAIGAIREALGGEAGERFEKRALQRAYPSVYRADPLAPMIEAALALPDLNDTQRAQIETLATEWSRDFAAAQAKHADALRLTEPKEPRRRMELAAQKAAGGTIKWTDAPELEQAKSERQELVTRYQARLAEILSDDQKEAVPGFGKPGAAIPAGMKYGDAIRQPGLVGGAGVAPGSPNGETAPEGKRAGPAPDMSDKPIKGQRPPLVPTDGSAPKGGTSNNPGGKKGPNKAD